MNFCFKFKMAAKNQNGGKYVAMVDISAAISPIMIIFSAFIIFQKPRSWILILYSILEFIMAAKIQDGCHKGKQFYKVAIELPVQEFFQWDVHFYSLQRCVAHNQYLFQCYNPKWRLKSKMADQKCSKVHISTAIPPILIIFQAFIILPRPRSLILILYSILEFNVAVEIQDGCQNVIQFYKVAIKLPV